MQPVLLRSGRQETCLWKQTYDSYCSLSLLKITKTKKRKEKKKKNEQKNNNTSFHSIVVIVVVVSVSLLLTFSWPLACLVDCFAIVARDVSPDVVCAKSSKKTFARIADDGSVRELKNSPHKCTRHDAMYKT